MRSEISPEQLSDLIGAIYDCAITPEKWTETIDAIRLEFDFKGGGFYVCALPSGSTRLQYTAGIEATAVDRIASYDSAALVEFWGGPTRANQYPLGEPIIHTQAIVGHQYERSVLFRMAEAQRHHR